MTSLRVLVVDDEPQIVRFCALRWRLPATKCCTPPLGAKRCG